MRLRWLVAILTLPVPVALLIPAGLLFLFRNGRLAGAAPDASHPACWAGAVAGVLGVALALWSTVTFARRARGTPAPWDPPTRFIAEGPYRFVRNPMIGGVIVLLLGEGLLLRSWPLLGWFAVFTVANCLYIPLVEEKRLGRRFGETYLDYKRRVPRWLPRWPGKEVGDE